MAIYLCPAVLQIQRLTIPAVRNEEIMCEYGEDHREIYKIDFKEKLKEEIIKCLKKSWK